MPDENDKTQEISVIAPGVSVAHYKVLSRIGAGGMGEVFLAEDTKLRRKIALKFLPPHFSANEDLKARFIIEAQSAAALNHPNIITIHEISEHQGRLFIAMEFVQGTSLRDMIDVGSMPLEAVVRLSIQICQGLARAHQSRIIHRDIKPDNILVDQDNTAKILDFGLAKFEGEGNLTQAGTTMGTANYMSPEQGQGKVVDHRSDIFAFGVVFYEMLTGTSPFKRSNIPATIHAIVHERPQPINELRPDAPEGFQAIIDHATAKKVDDRYASINDMIGDLQALQAGRQIEAVSYTEETAIIAVQPAKPKVQSLAVLYLRNLGSAADEFLSYGITEDLIVDLSRIGTIRVSPMRSILKYKDSNEELEEIGRHLDVGLVLDGSIHKSDKAIRFSAQLVDVNEGTILWADRWEEAPDNIQRIKSALANGISSALNIGATMVKDAQIGLPEAENAKAYELYLRAKYTFDQKKDKADVDAALKLYQEALELESSLLGARAGLAEAHIHKGEYVKAHDELQLALKDAQERDRKADAMKILMLLTQVMINQTKWEEATEFSDQALEIARQTSDLAGEAEALGLAIDILRRRAKFDQALKLFERALEINRQLEDDQKMTKSLNSMGSVYLGKGDYEQARDLYEQAIEIARKKSDHSQEAACTCNIGLTYLYADDSVEALSYYERALQMFDQLGDDARRATLINNIAVIHLSHGAYRKAIDYFAKAAGIQQKLGDMGQYALTHNNQAMTYTIVGDYEKAIELCRESLEIALELSYPLVMALANDSLGFAHFCKGEIDKAKDRYNRALKTAEKSELMWHSTQTRCNIAELYFHIGDGDQCREHAALALELAKELDEKEFQIKASAHMAAQSARDGMAEAAIERLRDIAEEAEDHGDPLYSIMAKRLLGQALYEYGADEHMKAEGFRILKRCLQKSRSREIAYESQWLIGIIGDQPDTDSASNSSIS